MTSQRSRVDWMLFLALSLLWAGAYALTRFAVQPTDPSQGLPAFAIIPARLTLGAAILVAAMLATGHRFPSLADWPRWRAIIAMGATGMTLPFLLITTAQASVDSSLAALYVAASPIFVALGAHALFPDERLDLRRGLGIAVGFAGVAALFGPAALANFGSSSANAQVMLVGSTGLYAVSTLIARGAPPMPSIVFAAGFVSAGAALAWPMLAFVHFDRLTPSLASILGVIGLGIGPSALASLLYMALVQRAGATFLSLTGYAIPVASAALGWVLFRETQSWNALLAFALILAGVWLAQRKAPASTIPPERAGAV